MEKYQFKKLEVKRDSKQFVSFNKYGIFWFSKSSNELFKDFLNVKIFYDTINKAILIKNGDVYDRLKRFNGQGTVSLGCKKALGELPIGKYFFEGNYDGGLLFQYHE